VQYEDVYMCICCLNYYKYIELCLVNVFYLHVHAVVISVIFFYKVWVKMEAADSSELLIITYQITRHYIPEASSRAGRQPKRGAKTSLK